MTRAARLQRGRRGRGLWCGWLFPALLLMGAPLAWGQATAGVGVAPDALLKAVDAHYNHLRSLRTRYTEHFEGMGQSRSESGTLLLRKPGRMRWNYDLPAGKVFVLDGKYAWFYTPGDPQAQRMPAAKLDDLRTPLRFLLGHTELKKELTMIAVATAGAGYRITGAPRGGENRVREVELLVTAEGAITAMKLEEQDGATTSFVFSATEENVPVREEDFRFVPPPGVAVVDAASPV